MVRGIWQSRFKRFLIAIAVALAGLMGVAATSEIALAQSPHSKQLMPSKIKKHHAQRHTHNKVARRHHEDAQEARDDSNDDAPPAKPQQEVVATLPAGVTAGTAPNDKVTAHSALPAIVSNAHAELTTGIAPVKPDPWPSNDTLTADDRAVSPDMSPTGVQVANADQLNDIDREMNAQTAQPTPAPAPAPVATAQIEDAAQASAQTTGLSQVANAPHGTPWNTASLIGKIFIGFGTLLTLASAARLMFA